MMQEHVRWRIRWYVTTQHQATQPSIVALPVTELLNLEGHSVNNTLEVLDLYNNDRIGNDGAVALTVCGRIRTLRSTFENCVIGTVMKRRTKTHKDTDNFLVTEGV
jgi:hypothetical protein